MVCWRSLMLFLYFGFDCYFSLPNEIEMEIKIKEEHLKSTKIFSYFLHAHFVNVVLNQICILMLRKVQATQQIAIINWMEFCFLDDIYSLQVVYYSFFLFHQLLLIVTFIWCTICWFAWCVVCLYWREESMLMLAVRFFEIANVLLRRSNASAREKRSQNMHEMLDIN